MISPNFNYQRFVSTFNTRVYNAQKDTSKSRQILIKCLLWRRSQRSYYTVKVCQSLQQESKNGLSLFISVGLAHPPCSDPHEGVDELVGDPDSLKLIGVTVAPASHAPLVHWDRFNGASLHL